MKRAVAAFAKTPLPGRVKTRLTPPLAPEESAELYRCMLLDTVARVRTLTADLFLCYDGDEDFFRGAVTGVELVPQHQGPLGERLTRAFRVLEERDFGVMVVIGTDSPDLPLEYIEEAMRLIEEGADAVFGPADDGGYYLVALNRTQAELFRDIPWSTDRALETSLQRAREAGLSTSLLPMWYDVDSIEDLSRPGLLDPDNGAPLTRAFLERLDRLTPLPIMV